MISAFLQTILLQGYSFKYGVVSAKIASWTKHPQRLSAQKCIDEIVRPHVKSYVDNHALANSTVFMRGGAKSHTARISLDVLASVINLLSIE